MADDEAVLVVPCFNEQERLQVEPLRKLACDGLQLLLVDDGSTDATGRLLDGLAAESSAIEVEHLRANQGKAEAVRHGLRLALERAELVGYFDADLATPPAEIRRLVDLLRADPDLAVVLGSRVARMGSRIDRRPSRHYVGRVFATVASLALGVTVYDTQCGAKAFRRCPPLLAALEEPFGSPWSFDVHLLDRLLNGVGGRPGLPATAFVEMPLEAWQDVRGSKLSLGASLLAGSDLFSIWAGRLRRRRTHLLDPLVATRPPRA